MNKPTVLMVNPWIYDFAAYNLWMRPVGLLRKAQSLRNEGYRIEFFDCLDNNLYSDNFGCGKFKKKEVKKPGVIKDIRRPYFRYGKPKEEFTGFLDSIKKPESVYISSFMTYWYPGVREVIEIIKKVWRDVPVTLGGVYPRLCPGHARENSGADIVLDKILDSKTDYQYPAWDLLSSTNSIVIQTSYGCPFNCSYCGIKLLCKGFHQRQAESVVDEIESYVKFYGTGDIAFYDDALLVNREIHIKPILRSIIERKINCRFHTPNGLHARYVDLELAGLMKESGFTTLRLSLETSSKVRKDHKVTNKQFLNAVDNLKKAGFKKGQIGVYTMFGSLDDRPEDIMNDIEFVTKKARVHIILSSYSLVPGSADSVRWGLSDKLDPLWHNNTIFPLLSEAYNLDIIKRLRKNASSKNKRILESEEKNE